MSETARELISHDKSLASRDDDMVDHRIKMFVLNQKINENISLILFLFKELLSNYIFSLFF